MPDSLSAMAGRTAVVTGAAGAMGRAVVAGLCRSGANVVGLDRFDTGQANETTEGVPAEQFVAIDTDVATEASMVAAFDTADRVFGPASLLVNLAGVNAAPRSILDCDVDEWRHVLDVNLGGTFLACREALRRMIPAEFGSVVNISSINGFRAKRDPQLHTHPYAISKAGVLGLTTTLAAEVGQYGIRINSVAPGMHMSPMSQGMFPAGVDQDSILTKALNATPLNRFADPEEIVGPVLFLLSDAAAYITGQLLVSDGGRTIWYD